MERPTPDVIDEYKKVADEISSVDERDIILFKRRSEELKLRRMKNADDYNEVVEEIKNKYPDGVVKEPHLINKGISKVIPLLCSKCDCYKIFPYQFLTKQGYDNGKNNCSLCMSINTCGVRKYTKKNDYTCDCCLKFDSNDCDKYLKHIEDKSHQNRLDKMLNGVRYNQKQLRELCSINNIAYYKSLTIPNMVKMLKLLGKDIKMIGFK